jgi:hypothetical protein
LRKIENIKYGINNTIGSHVSGSVAGNVSLAECFAAIEKELLHGKGNSNYQNAFYNNGINFKTTSRSELQFFAFLIN